MNISAGSALDSFVWTVRDQELSETAKKISRFAGIKNGWHFGDGIAPRGDLIKNAMELEDLAQRRGFEETDAFPGPNGELRYCVYPDDQYVEMTLEIDGSVTIVIEDEDGVEKEYKSTFEGARNVLLSFPRYAIYTTPPLAILG